MISPPRNQVGTVADDVSRSDLPRADSGAVLREHELRVVRCRYPLCPRRDCHPKDASAFGPPIRRISPGKVPLRNGRRTQIWSATFKDQQRAPGAPRSTWLLVVGSFPSRCRRHALCLLRMSDAQSRHGDGRGPSARFRQVRSMLRAYASRVGVFLRDFLSFFSRVAARSRALLFLACTTCVSGRLLAKDFSCGGGRCVCRRRVPRGRRVRFGASIFVREEKAHRRPPSSPATPGPRRFGVPVHGPQYPMFPMQYFQIINFQLYFFAKYHLNTLLFVYNFPGSPVLPGAAQKKQVFCETGPKEILIGHHA